MKNYAKPALWGFLFGTIGLLLLLGLSLATPLGKVTQPLYNVVAILLSSRGLLQGGFMDQKLLFFLSSGIFYAIIFVVLAWFANQIRSR